MATSPKKKSMVGWYDRRQLINTGLQVLISDLIGTRIDSRREHALASAPQERIIDYRTGVSTAFWFDYMSDTGDGWDPTFHVPRLNKSPILIEGPIRITPA